MSETLKPCPFCGAEAGVECITLPVEAAWNRRAGEAAARLDAGRKVRDHMKANWVVKATGDTIYDLDHASIEFPGTEDDAALARIVGEEET